MAALPTTGISTTLVGTTLGVYTRDVGSLCTSPNVNKWSKWKPVDFNKTSGLTLSDLQSINFGVSIVTEYLSPINLRDQLVSLGYDCVYNLPTGGELSPYRLGDFRNYYHDAVIPGGTSNSGDDVVIQKGSASEGNKSYYYDYVGIEITDSDINVELEDLYPLPVYRGIMLTNGATSYWKTGAIDWNDTLIKYWTGEVTAFQFYTNIPQATLRGGTSAELGAEFYSMPTDSNNQNPYYLYVTDEWGEGTRRFILSMQASWASGSVTYLVRFDARDYTASGTYLNNVYIYLYQSGVQVDVSYRGSMNLSDDTYIDFTGNFPIIDNTSLEVVVVESGIEQGRSNVIITA